MGIHQVLLVEISAESLGNADKLSRALLDRRLFTGGQIVSQPSRFWWKGDVVEMEYAFLKGYTLERHMETIIDLVSELTDEEVPMVTFVESLGNAALAEYVDSACG